MEGHTGEGLLHLISQGEASRYSRLSKYAKSPSIRQAQTQSSQVPNQKMPQPMNKDAANSGTSPPGAASRRIVGTKNQAATTPSGNTASANSVAASKPETMGASCAGAR